jgi:hypothetical protein
MDDNKIDVCIDKDLETLIPDFLNNRQEDINELKKAMELIKTESLRILGHNMRGLGGSYGFERITEIGEKIENAALGLESNLNIIEENSQDLREYLENINVVYK